MGNDILIKHSFRGTLNPINYLLKSLQSSLFVQNDLSVPQRHEQNDNEGKRYHS